MLISLLETFSIWRISFPLYYMMLVKVEKISVQKINV